MIERTFVVSVGIGAALRLRADHPILAALSAGLALLVAVIPV